MDDSTVSSDGGPSIEVTIKGFQDIVEKLGQDFTSPDSDWMGMVIMETEEGAALIPALFDENEKHIFATQFLPYMIDKLDPHTVCHVLSAWMVEGGPGEDPTDGPRPSEHPRRTEVVIIAAITIDYYEFWSAPIIRFPDKPPKLGPWRMWDDAERVQGEFFDPIRDALVRKAESA